MDSLYPRRSFYMENKKVSKTTKIIILIIFIILFTATTGIWRMIKELKILLQKYFGISSPKPIATKKTYARKGRASLDEKTKLTRRGDW